MNRKTFIFLTVTGAAAFATPAAGCHQYGDSLISTLGQPHFLGQVCDAKTIAAIGSAYSTVTPGESHRTDLIGLLLKDVNGTQNDLRLQQLLSERIRQDFTTGNIVTIKGWVLSRTEARQCAIFSLSQQ